MFQDGVLSTIVLWQKSSFHFIPTILKFMVLTPKTRSLIARCEWNYIYIYISIKYANYTHHHFEIPVTRGLRSAIDNFWPENTKILFKAMKVPKGYIGIKMPRSLLPFFSFSFGSYSYYYNRRLLLLLFNLRLITILIGRLARAVK